MKTDVRRLARRDGSCGKDAHSCLDIERAEFCCDNASYCYVNTNSSARCCPLGSNCVGDSPCASDFYYCTTTIAVPTVTATANATSTGCCGRKCTQTGYFLCPPDLGGKCCPYGSECAAGEKCLDKGAPSTTPSAVTAATSSAATTASDGNKGLTVPQSAGLGLGIAVGVVFIIATLVCLVWTRRTRNKVTEEEPAAQGDKVCAELMDGTNASIVPVQSLGRIAKVSRYFGLERINAQELETRNPPVELQAVSAVGRVDLDTEERASHDADVDSLEST